MMKVEIWSDIACPWCYIGRRRFEAALKQFPHRQDVQIIWRSFQLDPHAPREYQGSSSEMLMEKKGISRAQADAMHAQVTEIAAQEGLTYRFDIARPGNSFDAHRLLHFALHHQRQNELKERIQKAYFTEGMSFADAETLVKLAAEVGLDAQTAREVVEGNAYTNEVNADILRAQMLGIQGVPFFLFDEKYAVSGAQPAALFTTALERTWSEFHATVELIGGTDANACTDDSCAL